MTKLRDHPVYHRHIAEQRRKDEELFRKASRDNAIGFFFMLGFMSLTWILPLYLR